MSVPVRVQAQERRVCDTLFARIIGRSSRLIRQLREDPDDEKVA